jgi:hypothetical protein
VEILWRWKKTQLLTTSNYIGHWRKLYDVLGMYLILVFTLVGMTIVNKYIVAMAHNLRTSNHCKEQELRPNLS